MKELVSSRKILFGIFIFIVFTYYFLTTKGTFVIPHDLDYFNPLARAFLSGRLDIFPKPVVVSDLSFFNGKWYPYWGALPAIFLMIPQIILHRYIPAAYLSIFVAGLSMGVAFLVFSRLRAEYFPKDLVLVTRLLLVGFLAFGTSHLFIATRSGTWFVAQAVSFLPVAIALFILIKKKLSVRDYFSASFFISLTLIGRYNLVLAMVFLGLRFLDDRAFQNEKKTILRWKLFSASLPFCFFFSVFCLYNFARFGSPFDFGFAYTVFDYYNFTSIARYGMFSWRYVPMNLWRFFVELPQLTVKNNFPILNFNHLGISIFAVSPLFLAAFNTLNNSLASLKLIETRIQIYLWIWVIVQIALLAPLFTTGLNQLGLRYATDFALPLLCLAIFGLRGKLNTLAVLAMVISVGMNIYGLFAI